MARVPPYFDQLIAAYRAGHCGRHVHLGLWDTPPALDTPCAAGEFEAAQQRLTDCVIDACAPQPGHCVADIACGLGGTLATLAERNANLDLVALNIDARQLAACRSIACPGSLSLLQADACALPLAASSVDRVICLEAAFHFASRATFFGECARVMRPGARLVLTDILLRRPGPDSPISAHAVHDILHEEYGPWPDPWTDVDTLVAQAVRAGLDCTVRSDLTAKTMPSYRVIAPDPWRPSSPLPNAGRLMRWLHETGHLSYALLAFTHHPAGPAVRE